MPKLLRQNVGGTDYSMVGCALTATCATAAATAAKVAELTDGDVLADGMSVAVQFTNGNTAASPLTLTVGGVTANICDSRGQNIGGNIWQAGNVVTFLYTFGKFLLLNCVVDEVALNNMNSVSSNGAFNALHPTTVEVDCLIKGKIRLVKIGNLVIAQYFQIDSTTFNPTTEAQWVQIATIPQDYKPKYGVYFLDEGGNINIGRYQIYAGTNAIVFYRFSGQNYGWEIAFNVCWITN